MGFRKYTQCTSPSCLAPDLLAVPGVLCNVRAQ